MGKPKRLIINAKVLGIILLCVLSFTISLANFMNLSPYNNSKMEKEANISPSSTSLIVLHDMLHCFHELNLTHTLDNLHFEATYNYKITMTLETDHHGVQTNITLIDPEGDIYQIHNSKHVMEYNDEDVSKYGAAITGIHTLIFHKYNGPNVNVRILITKEEHCLQYARDEEGGNTVKFASKVYYDVIKVSKLPTGDPREYSWVRHLENNEIYYFYIGRVSPVALWYNPDTRLYFNITSPSGVLYQIWDDWPSGEWYNNSLPDAHVHKYFPFGTVGAGDYIIDFAFEQEPAHVNIAMVISYFEPASANVNSSDTTNSTTPPPDNSTTPPPISPTVPQEATIVFTVAVGILVFSVLILMVNSKYKKNN